MNASRLGTAFALALFWAAPLEAQTARVAYVNTTAVLAEYAPAQDAREQLETRRQESQSELQLISSGLETQVREYQQQAMTMTPEARQAREQELASQEQAMRRRTDELDAQFQQLQGEILQPIMDKVSAVIEELRVEGNYAMILDQASQVILAADPALELTQDVLTRLRAQDAGEDDDSGPDG